MTFLLSLRS